MIWTSKFWKETAERAIKSFCQALIVMWSSDVAFDFLEVDWQKTLGVAAGMAVLSVLTSIVSASVGPDKDSPSLV
jgi:hypothetical protein